MQVIKFNHKYLDQMAKLFTKSFSEDNNKHKWSFEKAKENLETYINYFGDYCFMALNDNKECMGAIFCLKNPYYAGDMLLIIAIIVEEKFRDQKVGSALMRQAFEVAKKENLLGLRLSADSRKEFPRKWYEKMGFMQTNWVEYEIFVK